MNTDVMTSIAEISVALLGFSGLAGIFGARTPAITLRLWVMVLLAFAILLLSLAPAVLTALGLRAPLLWMLCSAASAGYCLAHFLLIGPRIVRLRRDGAWGGTPALNLSFPALMVACFATQVLNATGIGLGPGFGGYLLGLVLLLACSGLNFVSLVFVYREAIPANDDS